MDAERVCYGCFGEKPDAASACPRCGFSPEEEQPFLALPMGTVLRGRYLIGKVLGVGGFGITYLGYDLVLEIKTAVKEYMPSGLATRHADRRQVVLTGRGREEYENGLGRFLEEARILARLRGTPHIVSVQDHFRENSTAYFVMEYVDGMSLKDYLASQGGKIPCAQAMTILQPVMEALVRVHGLGLTHRDISPDNIFLTAGGESKLLDFGAARFSAGDEKSVSVILKHGYAPEEQYSSHGSQGPWTDVYAMGATLYRCLTGELPPDAIARVRHDALQKPSARGIPLPAHLEAALMKAMAVKAEDRFPSMEAFLQAAIGGSAGADGSGAGRGRPAPGAGGGRREALQKPRALAAAALAVSVAIAGLGIWGLLSGIRLLTGRSDEPPVSASEPGGSEPDADTPGVGTPEDDGASQADLTNYTNASLNFSMKLPDDFTETGPGSAVFTSPDGSGTLQVGFYTCWSGFPVYSLADAEENAETYVRYFIGLLESTDITGYQILSRDYRQVGALNSYQVQFEAAESGGSAMGFLAAFLEGQNGFGCYNVIASYPRGDSAMQEALQSSVDSFRCLGPAHTGYRLLSDERLSFRFMYGEDGSLDFEIQDDIATVSSAAGSDYFVLTVSALPLAGTETGEQLLAQITDELGAIYPGIRQLGRQQVRESGGMEWIVRNYACESEGTAVYLSYAVSVWRDQAYLLIFTSGQEEQLEDNGLKADVMGSLRPAESIEGSKESSYARLEGKFELPAPDGRVRRV